MPRTSAPRPDNVVPHRSGKERILNSAMLLFARTPYSGTSLRDIAAAAQVDVAYVHRAFGSKAEIFRQALQALGPIGNIASEVTDGPEMVRRICDLAFLRDPRRLEDVRPLHLLIQSSLCNEAREIIADFVETTLALPLSRAFGHADTSRAQFAISLLSGFVIHRAVMGNEALRALPQTQQRQMLETALLGVICAGIFPAVEPEGEPDGEARDMA